MKTSACVIVDAPKMLHILGHQPLMFWSIDHLLEVRGLSRVLCVVAPKLIEQATSALNKKYRDRVEVHLVPPAVLKAKTASPIEQWLLSEASPTDSDVVLAYRPMNPFLPTAKLERCLRDVVRGAVSSHVVYPFAAITPAKTQTLANKLAGTAYAVNRAGRGTAALKTVAASFIESLNAGDPDEFVVIASLVESGKM